MKIHRKAVQLKLVLSKTVAYQRRWGWRNTVRRVINEVRRRYLARRHGGAGDGALFDLAALAPYRGRLPGRIAIHAHVFYPDLAREIRDSLACIPFAFDLYVSVTSDEGAAACRQAFGGLKRVAALHVERVPNRGRDIAPMLVAFARRLRAYDYVAHIHTKKSLYARGQVDGWRAYLFDGLFGSEDHVRRIFALFVDRPDIGIVYPQNFADLPYWANTWLANRHAAAAHAARLGIALPADAYFDYPGGSMFWARGKALEPLLAAGWTIDDFPEEAGQTDGTLAHCVERLLVLAARKEGLDAGILRDEARPSWSPWRVDAYFAQRPAAIEGLIASPDLRVVAFDIFDTLLTRPLLDPDATKAIVARRAGAAGEIWLNARHDMERAARERLRRDVNLADIHAEFILRGLLDEDTAARLQALEADVEAGSVAPRPDVVAVFRNAVAAGRRVVLVSDMFLPRATLEFMLAANDIAGHARLYLSNECNARKDAGSLYDYVLAEEKVSPREFLMIGDNERADIQIPVDRGMRVAHVMRPADQAAALGRWKALLPLAERGIDAQLALGLVVRRFFAPAFHGDAPPRVDTFTRGGAFGIGYAVVGPMLAAFSQWLLATARRDGVPRLYFLSREGQILQQAFDRLAAAETDAPDSRYLVLSRRAVTVAQIESIDDVRALAGGTYYPNSLENFLHYRYGLDLDAARLADLSARGLWKVGRSVEVAGEAAHLYPVLDHLAPEILQRAAAERTGLAAYLKSVDLPGNTCALVDVGYSGTIQDRLSRFLRQPVGGYYLMTSERAESVRQRHGGIVRGCFGERLIEGQGELSYWLHAFEVEQLLSSDDPQIACYLTDGAGGLQARHQAVTEREQAAAGTRGRIRAGAMAYIDDVVQLRHGLYPDFLVPADCATGLFQQFVQRPSREELDTLRELALDDHYCGRGVVAPLAAQHHAETADA